MPALFQAFARLVALKRLGVLLFVVAATLCASSTASAFEHPQTKTRVWGFELLRNNSSGLLALATSGKHQGNRVAQSELASGSLLAAEGVEAASAACKGGRCPCFVAGTLVDSTDGNEPIEQAALGDRVGPELEICGTTDFSRWREVDLSMTVEDRGESDELELRLLRPESWLGREEGTRVGDVVHVDLDDLNVSGIARVTGLGASPLVEPGARCPVTGWVRHTSRDVISLVLEGGEKLSVTRHHRFFSADRQDWVHASDLGDGEALQGKGGLVYVESVGTEAMPAMEVFNLEVFGAHQYFVGEQHVLAHNAYFNTTKEAVEAAKKLGYERVKGAVSHGQAVFTNGKRFITSDVDGHNGGVWKAASTIANLAKKATREGTFDALLNKIGD